MRNPLRITPKSTLGKWSLALIPTMVVLFILGSSFTNSLYKSVSAGKSILMDIAARPALALCMLSGMAAGADKGIVFAMLKHPVDVDFNERMTIAIPDVESVDLVWRERERVNVEKTCMQIARELAKLNPQGHIHAQEMYAAVNVIFRCPPTPVLNFLLTNPNIQHLGDLYFHLKEGAN